VILNEHPIGYLDEMQAQLTAVLEDGPWNTWQHRPGGAYLLRTDGMGRAERVLLETVARAILRGQDGDLRTQLDRPDVVGPPPTRLEPSRLPRPVPETSDDPVPSMALGNGVGGFTDADRTYAIVLDGADETPMPWANVIANAHFGTIITASGSAHT